MGHIHRYSTPPEKFQLSHSDANPDPKYWDKDTTGGCNLGSPRFCFSQNPVTLPMLILSLALGLVLGLGHGPRTPMVQFGPVVGMGGGPRTPYYMVLHGIGGPRTPLQIGWYGTGDPRTPRHMDTSGGGGPTTPWHWITHLVGHSSLQLPRSSDYQFYPPLPHLLQLGLVPTLESLCYPPLYSYAGWSSNTQINFDFWEISPDGTIPGDPNSRFISQGSLGKNFLLNKKIVFYAQSTKFPGFGIFCPETNLTSAFLFQFSRQQSFYLFALFVFGPGNPSFYKSPGDPIFFPGRRVYSTSSIFVRQAGHECASLIFDPMDRPDRNIFLMDNHGLFNPARLITGRVITTRSIPSEFYSEIRSIFPFYFSKPSPLLLPLPLLPPPLPLSASAVGSGLSAFLFSLRTILCLGFFLIETLSFFFARGPKAEIHHPRLNGIFSRKNPSGSIFRIFF